MVRHTLGKRSAGFSILEVLIGGAVLSIVMTSHVAGVLSYKALAEEETARSQAVLLAEQFMERLRTDDDFPSLYSRLRTNLELSSAGAGATLTLGSGRGAFPMNAYYPELSSSDAIAVLVDVPIALDGDKSALVLREDISDPNYGLPADLNGDGNTDADTRDGDYEALPVVVHFVWPGRDVATREMRLFTWLKGTR